MKFQSCKRLNAESADKLLTKTYRFVTVCVQTSTNMNLFGLRASIALKLAISDLQMNALSLRTLYQINHPNVCNLKTPNGYVVLRQLRQLYHSNVCNFKVSKGHLFILQKCWSNWYFWRVQFQHVQLIFVLKDKYVNWSLWRLQCHGSKWIDSF